MRRISIVICMLVLTTFLPLTTSATDTMIHLSDKNSLSYEKQALTSDDVVIQLLEQMDETLLLNYLEDLVAFGPRVTDTPACEASAAYIYNEFQSMGLAVRYQNWTNSGYSASNVEATLNGTDETSDEIYVVCGHYDSVTSSPGADDDGSGVVAAMAAAALMSQYTFNHTIRFVTFSGEEQGLLGSEKYVQEAVANGDNIVGTLNADMIGFAISADDGNKLKIYEDTSSEWLYTVTNAVNTQYSSYINLNVIHSGETWGSDHNSFWDAGYDALFYHEYNFNDYYHSSQDTIAHMNMTYDLKASRLILATLAELAEPGSLSTPPYPPSLIGPAQGTVNNPYSYTVSTTDPDGDALYYYVDWGDGTNSGWVGPFSSGTPTTISHSWITPGTYSVRTKAKDVNHASSDWSTPLTVTILVDTPPDTPTITGKTQGRVGVSYLYKVLTTDADGDNVYYFLDWGDNTTSDWLGPYQSGAQIGVLHEWSEQGTYTIKVKAKDIYDVESDWGILEVSMPTSLLSRSSSSTQLNQNSQPVLRKTV